MEGERTPAPQPLVRRLPWWVWLLGAPFFPVGTLICLAVARVIRWGPTILLIALANGLLLVVIYGLGVSESPEDRLFHLYVLLAAYLYYTAFGMFQYALGVRHGLWTPRAVRVWKALGILALAALVVCALTIAVHALK
jgi:hypothetical protein